ncbi:hypothetical protein [Lederbergia galactosidilytica]|uniref:Uncharacterized protein n=1 Tax=Lederbergia galactosidilytica TaxID=217031 RepID=A0A0Q9XHQ2_9BACI|nr:hypothetical protein [Lederbergia galactosidilytica]KRG07951.1 hypothetical protein ACA29_25225 [Lederbergia galactosidilytica]KRG15345.1 hypothetical protein ACA30_06895 [Virgibacillus soli]MBP1915776.1 hypothetical protein [Lederbergia galactosidilytica]OAK67197.1 hypothetical protein ABB05_21860 [Lederbergia galactosidilytica]
MEPSLSGAGSLWIQHQDLRIQVTYHIYKKHTEAFASYYYWEEESIDGMGDHPKAKQAIIEAIENLLAEMETAGMEVWTTTRPSTNQKVKFVMFQP